MYLQGHTYRDIAEATGVSTAQVGYDLKKIHEEWKRAQIFDMDKAKRLHLARVDHLEVTYWEAWERSMQPAETTRSRQKTGKSGQETEASLQKKGQVGDPRYLEGVRWCIQERAKILGLYTEGAAAPGDSKDAKVIRRISDELLDSLIGALAGTGKAEDSTEAGEGGTASKGV